MEFKVISQRTLKVFSTSLPTFRIEFQEEGASRLSFSRLGLNIELGDVIEVYESELVWRGMVWEVNDDDVVAVDLLIYFKNKHIVTYENILLSNLIESASSECMLSTGQIDATHHVHELIEMDGDEYLGVIYETLETEKVRTGASYHLFGHKGVIELRNFVDLVYRYHPNHTKPSIEYSLDDTYTQVIVANESGVAVRSDDNLIKHFGLLRRLEKDNDVDLDWAADRLLEVSSTVKKAVSFTIYESPDQLSIVPGTLLKLEDFEGMLQVMEVTHNVSELGIDSEITVLQTVSSLDEFMGNF